MNINNTLSNFFSETPIDFCRDDGDNAKIKTEITTFLKESNVDSKSHQAIELTRRLIKYHGKEPLYQHIAELSKVEKATRVLTEKRDHVIHTLNTFLLGVYISEKYLSKPVDSFQWKLTALFHDIAYPLEIAQKIIERYFKIISEIKEKLDVETYNATLNIIPKDLDKLTYNKSAFDLIQRRVYEWGLDVKVKKRYDDMIKDNKLCHGILSSLTVLYLIDLIYQKNNPLRDNRQHDGWEQKNFEKDIVPACSAIYIHNLPNRCFADAKIDRSKAPVAFLLKLSDCLQEWERPSLTNQKGFSAAQFDIKIDNDQLIFHADISDDEKKKIKDGILSSLVAPDVQIC